MCHAQGTLERRDPVLLTTPFSEVSSMLERLLLTMLPQETAQQGVADGQASVEAPNAIRFYNPTHTRDKWLRP